MRFFGGSGEPAEIRMSKLLSHSSDQAIPLAIPIGRQREGSRKNHSVQTEECHAKSAKDAKDAKHALGACLKIQFWVARATSRYVFRVLAVPVAQTCSLLYRRFSTCHELPASNVLPITNRRYGRL